MPTHVMTDTAVPLSTYRLQIHPGFTYQQAAEVVPYLQQLGVTHAFVSPILQAAPGSTHGYDVVDHSRVSDENGGEHGFRMLAAALHERGMGMVVDVVPNHMAIPTPAWLNRQWWDVLAKGTASEFWHWFDIDARDDQRVLVPVLGKPVGEVLDAGEIHLDEIQEGAGSSPVLRYFDHVFPVALGTAHLPLPELLDAQAYRLAYWQVGNEELNYRRFFDVTTLAGLRVEDPHVFEATHATVLRLHREGLIDGFRIDHPDGLADPRGYLQQLREATNGAWVVVEKILHADEMLPSDFECAGTTGYDAMWRIDGLFSDHDSVPHLTQLWGNFTHDSRDFSDIAADSAATVINESLWTEIERLTTLAHEVTSRTLEWRDVTRRSLERAIVALLTCMDRYRAYVVPGEPIPESERAVLDSAAARARAKLATDRERAALDVIVELASGAKCGDGVDAGCEFVTRFAQTCGPVHAKVIEDTAFYRYNRFVAVNEVGASPDVIGVNPSVLHEHCDRMAREWPWTMTTLSTHDTKRNEDVRGRLSAMTEYASEWESLVSQLHSATAHVRGPLVDPGTELLVWQILAGAWQAPGLRADALSGGRLQSYVEKAVREAKLHTAWVDGDPAYEEQVVMFAVAALESSDVDALFHEWWELTRSSQRAAVLGRKLMQLTMPGIPDVYQGNEAVDLSLVDPDNRRPVDHGELLARLTEVASTSGDSVGGDLPLGDEKLRLTRCALLVRRAYPGAFVAGRAGDGVYWPVHTGSPHAFAFARGESDEGPARAVTVVTRLARSLTDQGGWRDSDVLALDPGTWLDELTGRQYCVAEGEALRLSTVLTEWPVALLVRED